MKKVLTLVLAMLLLLTPTLGSAESTLTLPLAKESTTLTALAQITSKIIDMETNEMTLWVEQQTGVHIAWDIVEQGAAEKVTLLLNSGDKLPDILMVNLTYDQQYLYGKQGILTKLNDLIANNAPNITKAFSDYPMYLATSTRPDGGVYAITAYEECYHCTGAQKMYINQTWMDNLGLKTPTTPDEFYAVLKAFKEQDANGNGDTTDEIPLSGIANSWHTNMEGFLMNAFIYNDGNDRLVATDGVVTAAYTTDAWRKGMTYINNLFKEGLLDENAFVQDGTSVKTLTTGDVVRLGAIPAGHWGMFADVTNANVNQFVALDPLKGPDGVQLAGYYPNVAKTSDMLALSSTCSNPELAIKWTDFLFTEEATIRAEYGVKGVDWDYNTDQSVLGLNDEPALFHTFGKIPVFQATQMNAAWEHTAPFLWNSRIFDGQAVLTGPDVVFDLEKELYDATKTYAPFFPTAFVSNLSFDTEEAKYISETKTLINDFVKQSIAQYINGTRDITNDGDWKDYLDTLNAMDFEKYISVMQAGYDAQQALLKK